MATVTELKAIIADLKKENKQLLRNNTKLAAENAKLRKSQSDYRDLQEETNYAKEEFKSLLAHCKRLEKLLSAHSNEFHMLSEQHEYLLQANMELNAKCNKLEAEMERMIENGEYHDTALQAELDRAKETVKHLYFGVTE